MEITRTANDLELLFIPTFRKIQPYIRYLQAKTWDPIIRLNQFELLEDVFLETWCLTELTLATLGISMLPSCWRQKIIANQNLRIWHKLIMWKLAHFWPQMNTEFIVCLFWDFCQITQFRWRVVKSCFPLNIKDLRF